MSSEEFDFDPVQCKLVPKSLNNENGTTLDYTSSEEYYEDGLELEFDPGQSKLVPKTFNKRSTRVMIKSQQSYKNGEEFDFDPASSRLKGKSQRQKLEKFMENPNSSETMVFDPLTGKMIVQHKSNAREREADRRVMLDMNKQGPGGFFL